MRNPKGDSIEDLRKALEGRRVLKVAERIYDHGPAGFPYLALSDGSEVVILDGSGAPPLIEVEKPPYADSPLLWEGD